MYLHIIRKGCKGLLSIAFRLEGPELFPGDVVKNLLRSHIKYYYV